MFVERIYTRRLVMRRLIEPDLPLILAWSNNESASGPYLSAERYNDKMLRDQFSGSAFWNQKDKMFLLEKRAAEQPIGTIHYWLKSNQPDTAVVSLKVAEPNERGKGYGTEAQKYLIIFLFDRAGVKAVEMYTDIDNLAQQHCLTKLGFSIVQSLTYQDRQVMRAGYLFQLSHKDYLEKAIYRFHYE